MNRFWRGIIGTGIGRIGTWHMTSVASVVDNGTGNILFSGISPNAGTITYKNPGSIFDQTVTYSAGSRNFSFLPDGHITLFVDGGDSASARVDIDVAGGNLSGSATIVNGVIIMAGTGQGRLFSARCRMQEPNGRKFTLEGNGLDAAGAIGELEAKLALIDARVTVISAVRLTGNLSSGQITAFNTVNSARTSDAGGYDDVDITLRQVFNAGTATQVIETPVVRIQDAVNGIASASIDGTVDVTNTLVAALAAAYVDPDGNTGYAAYHGRFARS